MSTTTNSIELYLNVAGIIQFNQNLGMGGEWGFYTNPFDATQFLTVGTNGEPGLSNSIPTLSPDRTIPIVIFPDMTGHDEYDFEIDHIRLDMVGEQTFAEQTPRKAWAEILNLDETDGAIGEMGYYYLGQDSGDESYKLVTASEIPENPNNLCYRIKFSIRQGVSIKYCVVDPLVKTSSRD